MFRSRTALVLIAAVVGLLIGLGGAVVLLREPTPLARSNPVLHENPAAQVPATTQSRQAAASGVMASPTSPSIDSETKKGPRLEVVDCWFQPSPAIPSKCVHLFVRENRHDASSPLRRLSAVVFQSLTASKEPPLAFLVGGPGEPAGIGNGELDRWWSWIAEDGWLRGRDLIVLDGRGVGLSEPDMACPEMASAGLSVFQDGTALPETAERWRQAGRACAARLASKQIDVAQYNTEAMATDLYELLTGLGHRSWYLYGVSFGTRVALVFMREHPEGTRGAILDSVYPPHVRAYVQSAQNAAGAFDALFKQCDSSPSCRRAHPALARKFETIVRRAERMPYSIVLESATGQIWLRIDHVRLIEILFYAFYEWREIARIPAAITALEAGDTKPFTKLAQSALRYYEWPGASHGLFFAVTCTDEMPFNPLQEIAANAAREPLFEAFAMSNPPLYICRDEPRSPTAASTGRELPTAAIPTLILSGELDPVTPPSWAADTAQRLPKATLIRFGSIGHGVVSSHSCADRLIAEFLRDPSNPPFDPCQLALGPPEFTLASGLRQTTGAASRGGGRPH